MSENIINRNDLINWYINFLKNRLGELDIKDIENKPFSDLGLDSMDAIILAGEMEVRFRLQFEPEIFLNKDNFSGVLNALGINIKLHLV